MNTTMPRSALRHRMININSDQILPPIALRASKTHLQPTKMAFAISADEDIATWPWSFGAGMLLTLILLLIGHLIHLPTF